MTMMFPIVILGAIDKGPQDRTLADDSALTLIHLISIPVTNTSVNPARSTGVAVFQRMAISELWFLGCPHRRSDPRGHRLPHDQPENSDPGAREPQHLVQRSFPIQRKAALFRFDRLSFPNYKIWL